MEPTYSEAMFVLKVNKDCQACWVRMMVALGSVCGVYDVEFNADEGVARFRGVVDPNMLIKAFAGSGHHAKCIGFRIRHPRINSNSSSHNNGITDPYYSRSGYLHNPCSYGHALPLPFNIRSSSFPYHSTAYYPQSHPCYGSGRPPPARYDPCYAHRRPRPFRF